jgi:uncharacterized protein
MPLYYYTNSDRGDAMNLFVIADIHGAVEPIGRARDAIGSADAVVIAGDLSRRGASSDAERVIGAIEEINRNIIAVPGNWDGHRVIDMLQARNISVHGRTIRMGDVVFFGCGGAPKSFIRTPTVYTEKEIERFLDEGYGDALDVPNTVMVTHTPPRGILDRAIFRIHAGSRAVREFIESRAPRLVVCGHIHEDPGVQQYHNTLVVNPGSFRKGKFCRVVIHGAVRAEQGTV